MTAHASDLDPYLWLEEVESEKALQWAREHNEKSLGALTAEARFDAYEATATELLNATDRIPYPRFRGGEIYNFWQDADHVRGIWRKTSLAS